MDDFENKYFVRIPQNNDITKKIIVVPLSGQEENKDEHRGKIFITYLSQSTVILNFLINFLQFLKLSIMNYAISKYLWPIAERICVYCNIKKLLLFFTELIKLVSPPYKEKITLEDTTSDLETKINYIKSKQQRKGKLIENLNHVSLQNAKIDGRKNNQKTDETKDRNGNIDSETTYAVKENLEEENPSASNQKLIYNKESDTAKTTTVNTKNNLTANLLDILANYNIRIGDNLRNYDISLRENSRNSNNHDYIFIPVPIKLPARYNNANHLPVDPLLSVFLSNYGHYIPSLYGIHSGYNNLYGYLASNNIHNNKPSGSYKIFSDTDSFHWF